MREIKFKCWDNFKKRWTNYKILDDSIYFMDKNTGVWFNNHHSEYKRFELMQYTGIKDKNGTEIYEGDILWNTYDECYGEVTFEEGEWKFEDSTVIQPLYSLLDCIEIKGNIYENNELLE